LVLQQCSMMACHKAESLSFFPRDRSAVLSFEAVSGSFSGILNRVQHHGPVFLRANALGISQVDYSQALAGLVQASP
ncbi:MAG: hypothetical protein P8Y36_14740, partial [Alphaproteobacteria bacterium]